MFRFLRLGAVAFVLGAIFVLFGSMGAAGAATPTHVSQGVSSSVQQSLPTDPGGGPAPAITGCSQSAKESAISNNSGVSNYLPINRWGNAASDLRSRLGASPLDQISQKLQRNMIQSTALSVGNSLWQASTGMVTFAVHFCLFDSVGGIADQYAADIGNALLTGGLVAVLIVMSIFVLLWRAYRAGGSSLAGIGKKLVILGIFGVLLTGAHGTTFPKSTAGVESGPATFGTFSPGWIASNADNMISSVADVPAQALAGSAVLNGLGHTDPNNQIDCSNYIKQLHTDYQNAWSAYSGGGALPESLDAMWENTGLQAYIDVQFGVSNNNYQYGNEVACRLLDYNSGIPGTDQPKGTKNTPNSTAGIFQQTSGFNALIDPGSNAWQGVQQGGNNLDEGMIGWAACEWNGKSWSASPGFTVLKTSDNDETGNGSAHPFLPGGPAPVYPSDSGVGDDHCSTWFSGEISKYAESHSIQAWYGDGGGLINSSVANSIAANPTYSASDIRQAGDFLLTYHGVSSAGSTTLALIFLIASFIVFIVFMILAVAVIAAKVAVIVMMMLSLIVLCVDLAPSGDGNSRAFRYFKHMVSMMLFACGIQLILAVIALITGFMVTAGADQFGPGSIISMIWTGFAPLTAIWVVHHLFKQVIKAPSPFSPSAALAWGAAGGGIGAGLGVGMDRIVSRGRSMTERKLNARSMANAYAKRTGAGGRKSNAQGMAPTGPGSGGAGTGPKGTGPNGSGPGGPVENGFGAPLSPTQQARAAAAEQRKARGAATDTRLDELGDRADAARRKMPDWMPEGLVGAAGAAAAAGGFVGSRLKDRAGLAVDRFRQSPIRSSLKGAGILGAAVLAPWGVGVTLGGIAAARGLRRANTARQERPMRRAQRNQRHVDTYRAEQQRRRTLNDQASAAANEQERGRQDASPRQSDRRANGRRLFEENREAEESSRRDWHDRNGPPPEADPYDEPSRPQWGSAFLPPVDDGPALT